MMPKNPQRNNGLLNIENILKILPHRYPFLLVDRVLELEKGKSIVAIKNITYNEHFFQGHFPHLRVMPGVLVIEALAQAGGILLYHSLPNPEQMLVLLGALNNTKFRKTVVPGDQLRLEVHVTKIKGKYCQSKGKAYVNGRVVAETEFIASVISLDESNEQE